MKWSRYLLVFLAGAIAGGGFGGGAWRMASGPASLAPEGTTPVAGTKTGASRARPPAISEVIDPPALSPEPSITPTPNPIAIGLRTALAVRTARSYGAAVLIAPGVALTVLHAVEGAPPVEVRFHDTEWQEASVVARDEALDLAVLRLAVSDRDPAELAGGTELRPGDPVVTVGNPREMAFSVSRGTVSFVRREMNGVRYLQTDLTVNPGNSGGPVLDADGRVVALMSFMLRNSAGIAFAIPVEYAASRFPEHVRLDPMKATGATVTGSDRSG